MHLKTKSDIYFSCFLLLMVLMVSCSKDLKLPDVAAPKKIVLIGEIIAGDSINIRGGQSTQLSSAALGMFALSDYLSVNVKDASGTTTLTSREDSLLFTLQTIPFSTNKTAAPGATYTFTASHPDMGTATATVTMPLAFTASVTDTGREIYANANTLRADVTIKDGGGDNFYVIEAVKQLMDVQGFFLYHSQRLNITEQRVLYDSLKNAGVPVGETYDTAFYQKFVRENIYTIDASTENLTFGTAITPNKRILLKDNTFANGEHTVRVFAELHMSDDDTLNGRGRLLITVKSVPEEYFNFLKGYEQTDAFNTFNVVTQPVKVQGNVANGFGMIGAAFRLQFPCVFDNWHF